MKNYIKNHKIIIGRNIKRFREQAGFGQREFAVMIGYKTNTPLSLIEDGKRGIDIGKLRKISVVLGIPCEVLLSENDYSDEQIDMILQFHSLLIKPDSDEYTTIKTVLRQLS